MEYDDGKAVAALILGGGSLMATFLLCIGIASALDVQRSRIEALERRMQTLETTRRICSVGNRGWLARSDGNCYTEDMPK